MPARLQIGRQGTSQPRVHTGRRQDVSLRVRPGLEGWESRTADRSASTRAGAETGPGADAANGVRHGARTDGLEVLGPAPALRTILQQECPEKRVSPPPIRPGNS